jgi:hypothetical protein
MYGVGADGVTTVAFPAGQFNFEGTNADAEPVMTSGALAVENYPMIFNGATFDRARSAPDNADGQAALTLGTPVVLSRLQGWNGTGWDRIASEGNNVDGDPLRTLGSIPAQGYNYGFNGATWDRVRSPNVYKYGSVVGGGGASFNIWTPAAGKKFRLMGFVIQLAGNATQAAAGNFTLTLFDGATALPFAMNTDVPAAAPANTMDNQVNLPSMGNGFLSAAANNILSCTMSAALVAGNASVMAFGTEE